MRKSDTDLPDINVWVAMADPLHAHHPRARRYWEDESAAQIAFCRITMMGFLRLLTNKNAMDGRQLVPNDAWRIYRSFRDLPEVVFLPEPVGLEAQMESWSDRPDFGPKLWTDCCLASWSVLSRVRLVSFDSDYATFAGVDFLHLA